MGLKIAIVGGGMAGLTAAYILRKEHDVTLYEKDGRLGGNAHTITTSDGLSFDIAAAVFGKNSYPSFRRLLSELDVPICRFSGGGVGWKDLDTGDEHHLSTTWRGLTAQNFAMFKPRFFADLLSNFRVFLKGKKLYKRGLFEGLAMEDALKTLPELKGDSRLLHLFVLCIVSSMYYKEVASGPADFFFGKMATHTDFFENFVFGLFQAEGNTKSYVDALASRFSDRVVLNSKIKSVARGEEGVTLRMEHGDERFDKVVFACNADQALALLEEPTDKERRVLGAWRYKEGPIVVHTDRSAFPDCEHYNLFTFLYTDRDGDIHTSVNGHIRNLKSVPDDCLYISSQHPNFPIDEAKVEYSKVFRTPVYDFGSVAAQKELPSLNGVLNTYYCGSHFGYGLHEDCVDSAARVAWKLGVRWP